MIKIILLMSVLTLFISCSKHEIITFDSMPNTQLILSDIDDTFFTNTEESLELLHHFQNNCQYSRIQKLYGDLCEISLHVSDAEEFFLNHFNRYQIVEDAEHKRGLLTGYFEPLLYGSRSKSAAYPYPLYEPPLDLLHVDLGSAYAKLKNMRLRGKLVDGKIVAYDDRKAINTKENNLSVICYVSDRIARFFLEVQGSGRVKLDSGESIFVGYANQNGHAYTSIGKVLIENEALSKEEVSLQSIRKWLQEHPESLDDILHANRSLVFFKERSYSATGALGIELTPKYSVAVDPRFIPLGSLLDIESASYKHMVFAEDTGGAIRGSVRADLFLGFGDEALEKAGILKEKLKLFMWLPKNYQGKMR
ncbi:MAG: murein transglycosylase A [Campylobacterota bacterium]|nr:murein transglycosylase A [Campylobacterota bacterium]